MTSDRARAYGVAAIIGTAWVAYAVPWATLCGTGGVFTYPNGDLPMHLGGHLALQVPGWHWPLLRAPVLAWPRGESVAMTDSNPLLSLLAKLVAGAAGHAVNLFGVWLAFCYVMQPLCAVYLLRGFFRAAPARRLNSVVAAAAAAVLALLLPEYLFRVIHINLLGQFLLLMALGQAVRSYLAGGMPRFAPMAGLLIAAVLIHPYLFIFCALILAAPVLALALRRDAGTRPALRLLGLAVLLPPGIFVLLSGSLGAGGPGYGLYSTNLLSPVWPQRSGLFGSALPILDATGYQYEGFNYLGAGALLVLAAAGGVLARAGRAARRDIVARHAGLLLAGAALAALAITPHVTFGTWIDIPFQPALLERLFAVVRASGRAIWAVDYAVIIGALGLLAAHLPARFFLPLAAAAIALQWLDTAPLRRDARLYYAGAGQYRPAFAIPAGATLFRALPLCGPEEVVATEYRLLALRAGVRLANMRLTHAPPDAVCGAVLRAGLNTVLEPGETRLFMPSVRADVQRAALGDAACFNTAVGLVCHRPAGT